MLFQTNAKDLDELDIAWEELRALQPGGPWGRSFYTGRGEFQGGESNFQQAIDRLAMFDSGEGLTDAVPTRWANMREGRYDRTLDHSTHNLYPFTGKLEPRLARACINIAVGPKTTATVADPFCGSGTVLLEANLMGFNNEGSDIDEFAYWLSMMKLSLDADEYIETVKKLHLGHDSSLVRQRLACPPRKIGGRIHKGRAVDLLKSLFEVDAIVTSPPYYDAIDYNARHADLRRRLGLSPPTELTMGIGQSLQEYRASIEEVSQAMFDCLASRGRIVIIAASYRGVDTPIFYENALRNCGLMPINHLKRRYRQLTLDIDKDIITVMEKP